ncbi:MAG: GNAT family N-acetyltransferase, partial [Clostridiales bacterium]|nr:GNAT family N-acetyltransferase [Clostridiales bacterium]
YSWQEKRRENLKTGFLLIKKLGSGLLRKSLVLKKFNTTVGRLCKGEYYLSNIAIYPRFRGKGLGKELISEFEKRARTLDVEKIILDVEKDNLVALSFYKNLGFTTVSEFSIFLQMDKTLFFNRLAKRI